MLVAIQYAWPFESVLKSFTPGTPSEPGKYASHFCPPFQRNIAVTDEKMLFVAGLSGVRCLSVRWPR
ncbi:MAG: hypothetical protein IPG47_10240 [Thermoflexaceae bacterium]|nr:hypothetical protein [Thermoflexaceae bacterium]